MFSDLECDYINPIDLCNKLNQVNFFFFPLILMANANPSCLQFVLPENIAHAFLTILFLISGQWTAFLLNAPLLAFNVNKYEALSTPCTSI
jgi:protein cornichon